METFLAESLGGESTGLCSGFVGSVVAESTAGVDVDLAADVSVSVDACLSVVATRVVGSDTVAAVEDSITCEDDVVINSIDEDVVVGADDDVLVDNTVVGAVVVVIVVDSDDDVVVDNNKLVGAVVIVVVVVVDSDGDAVVDNTFVGAVVVVVVNGWTTGGSTCMTIANCFEHGLVAPSVATMTTGNVPKVSGDTDDDIRPDVESMSNISRTTLSVPTLKPYVTLPLSPKSSSLTSTRVTVVLTSVDTLT